jgi:broad specificity phosphatase PhoE
MQLYIVRHGETDWNKAGRWQGCADVPLNDAGVAQAQRLRDRLGALDIRRVYSSDLCRAARTAEILNQALGAPLVRLPALREMRMGEWEGKTKAQLAEAYPRELAQWEACSLPEGALGIESFPAVQARAVAAVEAIAQGEGDAVVVSHAAFIRALLCFCLRVAPQDRFSFDLHNAGLSLVRYRPEGRAFRVVTLNDYAHTLCEY